MKFTGIRRTFSTQNEEQYTTIGPFGMMARCYMK